MRWSLNPVCFEICFIYTWNFPFQASPARTVKPSTWPCNAPPLWLCLTSQGGNTMEFSTIRPPKGWPTFFKNFVVTHTHVTPALSVTWSTIRPSMTFSTFPTCACHYGSGTESVNYLTNSVFCPRRLRIGVAISAVIKCLRWSGCLFVKICKWKHRLKSFVRFKFQIFVVRRSTELHKFIF